MKRGPKIALGLLAVALLLPLASMELWAEKVHNIDEEGMVKPKLIYKVEPQYNEEARAAGIEGKVVLYAEVTSDGEPDNVQVKESLDPGLDANAIAAVNEWRFDPGRKDGKPVRTSATIEINFRLE